MSKSQQVYQDMMDFNKELFDNFRKIYDLYTSDTDQYQLLFNEEGEKVLQVIRRYENILCSHSESGKYSKFSAKLSENFWDIIRKQFPKIDCIGLQI